MDKQKLMENIGQSCKTWRVTMDYKLTQVAEETGYSPASITFFECGALNNAVIFSWYIARGFDPKHDMLNPEDSIKFKIGMDFLYYLLERSK